MDRVRPRDNERAPRNQERPWTSAQLFGRQGLLPILAASTGRWAGRRLVACTDRRAAGGVPCSQSALHANAADRLRPPTHAMWNTAHDPRFEWRCMQQRALMPCVRSGTTRLLYSVQEMPWAAAGSNCDRPAGDEAALRTEHREEGALVVRADGVADPRAVVVEAEHELAAELPAALRAQRTRFDAQARTRWPRRACIRQCRHGRGALPGRGAAARAARRVARCARSDSAAGAVVPEESSRSGPVRTGEQTRRDQSCCTCRLRCRRVWRAAAGELCSRGTCETHARQESR